MSHEDYKEMIPAHALSALDAPDDRTLADHLARCADCQKELSEWHQTAAALAWSTSPAEPSPLVRQRILSQVRFELNESQTPKVIPFKSSERNVWRSFGSLGAIAAAVLFVLSLGSLYVLWQQNRAMKEELKLVKLIQTPGAKVMELTGTTAAPGASAKVAFDVSGHAMVMTNGLPAAPAGKEYQLWFMVADKPPMRGRTFSTDSQGKGMLEDQLPAVALKSAAFAVTLEPQGGSENPTMPIYLSSGL